MPKFAQLISCKGFYEGSLVLESLNLATKPCNSLELRDVAEEVGGAGRESPCMPS